MLHTLLALSIPLLQAEAEAPHAAAGAAETPAPPAEILFHLGPVPVTNAIVTTWLVMLLLVLIAFLATRRLRDVPSGLQNVVEMVVELWMGQVEQNMGRRGRRFLPLLATAFIFIVISNWFGTLPIVGPITIQNGEGHTFPVLRSAASDLNLTAAMAVLMIVLAEVFEFRSLGPLGYLRGLFLPNPMRWLEILTRPLSLAFRLFGNIFAGEVLIATMLSVAPFALFIFLGLELFVGLIQALIFAMLSLVFLTIATAHEEAHEHEQHPGEPQETQTRAGGMAGVFEHEPH